MSNLANTLRDLADEHSLELSDSARQALEEAASLLFRQSTEIAALTAALTGPVTAPVTAAAADDTATDAAT